MEYTDYFVVRSDAEALAEKLAPLSDGALLMDDGGGPLLPFVALWKPAARKTYVAQFDWLLSVFDAESAAWGFSICVSGEEVGSAVYGDNAEWGIAKKDNGLTGELEAIAEALGVPAAKFSECLHEGGVEGFCTLVGFEHAYMLYPHERELKGQGIQRISQHQDL